MHIIFETVLMLFTENYTEKQSMLVETTGCQSWRFFDTVGSFVNIKLLLKAKSRRCSIKVSSNL